MDIFSARLKFLRERIGMTQADLANKLGVSQSYYNRFEKGTSEPNLETLVKLPSILHESIEFLLGLKPFDRKSYRLISWTQERFMIRRRIQVKLDALIDIFKSSPDEMTDKYLNMIADLKEELRVAEKEYQLRFNELMSHIKNIPLIDEEYLDEKSWMDKFEQIDDLGK